MQVSQIYRRGVVLPLDAEAERQLRRNDLDRHARIKHLSIPNEDLFAALWDLQLFADINARCGSLIDDYEQEFIEPVALGSVIEAAGQRMGLPEISSSADVQDFLAELVRLAEEARSARRPLLFVL